MRRCALARLPGPLAARTLESHDFGDAFKILESQGLGDLDFFETYVLGRLALWIPAIKNKQLMFGKSAGA